MEQSLINAAVQQGHTVVNTFTTVHVRVLSWHSSRPTIFTRTPMPARPDLPGHLRTPMNVCAYVRGHRPVLITQQHSASSNGMWNST